MESIEVIVDKLMEEIVRPTTVKVKQKKVEVPVDITPVGEHDDGNDGEV